MVKIFVDLGHGGTDGGAQGNGLSEKDLNLKIGKKMEALLKNYSNAEVKLSRTTDKTMSLSERTQEANLWRADVLVSVHINSATSSQATGFESFIYNKVGAETVSLQNVVHQEILNSIKGHGVVDRGKKRANFHMLRESAMSAILTENLFIVNKKDSDLLKSDDFLDKLAQGHVKGLERFYGLKPMEPSRTEAEPATSTGKLYKVQIGAFSNKQNAENLASKAKKSGYNVYIVEE